LPEEIHRIRRGGLLHDVGKIGVPSRVLDKPDALTQGEIAILRSHVEQGARILEPVEDLADVLPIVWQHHERLDGSGYPRGLRGDEIDPAAALVAVADVYEALTTSRPYRAAWEPERADRYLESLAGVQLDSRAVETLVRIRSRQRSWRSDESESSPGTGDRAPLSFRIAVNPAKGPVETGARESRTGSLAGRVGEP
jgi:HD-GYP domain-containing protein (c-di-GMP phosphodiesterase class II)